MYFYGNLAIAKATDVRVPKFQVQFLCYPLSKRDVRTARKKH